MDEGFIKRVCLTSVAVWLFVIMLCGAHGSLKAAIGVTIGYGISVGSLALIDVLVRRLFTPDSAKKPGRALKLLAATGIAKYAFMAIIIFAALSSGYADPIAIAAGVAIVHAVILFKALGIALFYGMETSGR